MTAEVQALAAFALAWFADCPQVTIVQVEGHAAGNYDVCLAAPDQPRHGPCLTFGIDYLRRLKQIDDERRADAAAAAEMAQYERMQRG